MKSKEEILEAMKSEMPFELLKSIEPYILEAMEAYHEDKTRELNEELKSLRCELNAIYESEAGADL